MKTMLFVDDRSKRMHAALKKYVGVFALTVCSNVPEALRYLSQQEWDVVSLDFDLNGHDFQDPDDPTCGMEIVRYIGKTGWPFKKYPHIVLHSSNAFGRKLMAYNLEALGFVVEEQRFEYD
jgi:CheY-like chemotaxis protein